MSVRHDRELADTLEAEAQKRRGNQPYAAALLREAAALRQGRPHPRKCLCWWCRRLRRQAGGVDSSA